MKILVWNLQTFGVNKINNPSTARGQNQGGLNNQQASHARRRIVYRTLQYTQPDVIIIIEVGSGDSYPNYMATFTSGMEGASYVLNFLRTSLVYNHGDWRMVPPLRIGRANGSKPETVAVLYRGRFTAAGATRYRYFTGPNIWTGGYNGSSLEPIGGPGAPYPTAANGLPDLNVMLVPTGTLPRTIPATALHNGGRFENRVAARNQFREDDHGAPGEYLDFGVFREPYMVTFTETDGGGAVLRNISLFAVHSPAVAGDAGVFVNYLASSYDVASALGAAETRVVAGDFNLNLLNAARNYSGVYDPLRALNYSCLLFPAGGAPVPLNGYEGYFATHIKPVNKRNRTQASKFLWSDGVNLSYYPGYGYIGSDRVADFYSIDNILVRPFIGLPHNYETTIMNHVVGTPFNQVLPTPGGAPPGTLALVDGFTNVPVTVAWPQAPTAGPWSLAGRNNLSSWANYGYIYRTSDHFALYADV